MNILIVYTHPNHSSLNYAFLQSAIKGLKANAAQHNLQILDLYEEDFDPRLTFDQNKRRRDLHVELETQPYRDQITWADHIVFIYPIWWGRPPAMLLGYVDRLFVTDFAYRYDKSKLIATGLLKDKKVTCISTMKGPTGYLQLFLGNVHKLTMKRALFEFVGIKKVRFFEFGSAEGNPNKNTKKLGTIQNYFTKLV